MLLIYIYFDFYFYLFLYWTVTSACLFDCVKLFACMRERVSALAKTVMSVTLVSVPVLQFIGSLSRFFSLPHCSHKYCPLHCPWKEILGRKKAYKYIRTPHWNREISNSKSCCYINLSFFTVFNYKLGKWVIITERDERKKPYAHDEHIQSSWR